MDIQFDVAVAVHGGFLLCGNVSVEFLGPASDFAL